MLQDEEKWSKELGVLMLHGMRTQARGCQVPWCSRTRPSSWGVSHLALQHPIAGVSGNTGPSPVLEHVSAPQSGGQLAVPQDSGMRTVCTQGQGRESAGPEGHCRHPESISREHGADDLQNMLSASGPKSSVF